MTQEETNKVCGIAHDIADELWESSHLDFKGNFEVKLQEIVKNLILPVVSNSVICPDCDGKGWTIPTDRVPFDCKTCNGTGKL